MKTRIICAALVAAMLLAFAACGPAKPVDVPPAETSADTLYGTEPTEPFSENFPTEEPTTEDGTEESTTGIDTTNGGTTVADDTTKAEVKAPVGGSTAQIVEFYNKYANEVKAAEKITIKKHDVRESSMDIPGALKLLMPKDQQNNLPPDKNETVTDTFVKGKGTKVGSINDFLPVVGKSYVSKLSASNVQSASCEKQGEGWIVKINLKDEKIDINATIAGEGTRREPAYATCMDVDLGEKEQHNSGSSGQQQSGSEGDFDSSAFSMEGAFQNGAIVAVFDKNGQLTSLTTSFSNNTSISIIGMKVKSNTNAKQEYQLTW